MQINIKFYAEQASKKEAEAIFKVPIKKIIESIAASVPGCEIDREDLDSLGSQNPSELSGAIEWTWAVKQEFNGYTGIGMIWLNTKFTKDLPFTNVDTVDSQGRRLRMEVRVS